jgi:hypothetical protein
MVWFAQGRAGSLKLFASPSADRCRFGGIGGEVHADDLIAAIEKHKQVVRESIELNRHNHELHVSGALGGSNPFDLNKIASDPLQVLPFPLQL